MDLPRSADCAFLQADAQADAVAAQVAWLCSSEFTSMHTFRADTALGTWLAGIAINVALDAKRKSGRPVQLDDSQDFSNEPTMEHLMAFSALTHEAPDTQAEIGQLRTLLQRAIESFPPIYRSVFILRAV